MDISKRGENASKTVCPKCGEMVADTCKYCPGCGTEIRIENQRGHICGACGAAIDEGGRFCPVCGKPVDRIDTAPSKSMKWYKFVIWVQLFLSALVNLGTGIRYLSGMAYGEVSSTVYYLYSGLKPLDILMGLLSIAAAVLAIFVRQSLARYKKSGPGLYYIYWVFGFAYNLIYLIGLKIVGVLDLIGSQIGVQFGVMIAMSVVMLVLNVMYFTKRANMFVN